jgi:hypothetical protein
MRLLLCVVVVVVVSFHVMTSGMLSVVSSWSVAVDGGSRTKDHHVNCGRSRRIVGGVVD